MWCHIVDPLICYVTIYVAFICLHVIKGVNEAIF